MKTLKVIKALQFAADKHKGQVRRESGLPYITHPIIVMELLQKYKGSSKNIHNLKCAALLHDTLEDTECSYLELERNFGPMVASIVLELTSDDEQIKKMGKNEYLKQKMLKMSKYALTLKLVDRLSNILDAPRKKYVSHTISLVTFLKEERDLNDTQKAIIDDILSECNKLV